MGKIFKYTIMLFLAFSVFSCTDKKKSKYPSDLWDNVDSRMHYGMERTKEDTTQVLSIAKEYLDLLQENRVDEALSKLYEIEGDSIAPLSTARKKELEHKFAAFPVLSYKITEVLLFSETDTEVRYTSTFFEKSEDDGRPNTIQCVLNPKRINNIWYLTVSDETREPELN